MPNDILTAPIERVIEFPDNFLLIDLCGEHDKNLAEIEERLGIQILRRGNQLTVLGEEAAVANGTEVLQSLYSRLETGRSVENGDIDRELRMGHSEKETPIQNGDQMELFKGSKVEIKTRKKLVEPRTDAQKEYVKSLFKNELAFGIGPAGTGKTYLAVACAVEALMNDEVRRILLVRPAVEAGEKLGFLPGDLSQKIDPYLRPLYDALYEMLGFENVEKLIEKNVIEVAPLAYMRGRTLNNSYIILDESQNTTREQMKMFLTRIGFGSTAVITGDATQIDLPKGSSSGLLHVMNVLKDVKGISFTQFLSKDVVRHPLVQRVVEAYEKFETAQEAKEKAEREQRKLEREQRLAELRAEDK